MSEFLSLVRRNRNYRFTWLGQVVSEIGDHFNNVAVYALVIQTTSSGLAVSGVLLARAIPAVLAGPVAGVVLDRLDRRRTMIASDLVRAVVAALFVLTVTHPRLWLLYVLSAILMFASPFFTAGRAAILPSITSEGELHAANSLTQTTQWATQVVGAIVAGYAVAWFGYSAAFLLNAVSFLLSAGAIWALRRDGGFRTVRAQAGPALRPWSDYRDGLLYIWRTPLILGIGLISVGWAAGGGAAQILFVLFAEQVFHRGAQGIGALSGFAGIGLLIGGVAGHLMGRRVGFAGYKHTVSAAYVSHGLAYVLFSLTPNYGLALAMMAVSRVGMAVTSVLNYFQLLKHTPDEYRGRVFATMESLRWSTMMLSFAVAGIASNRFTPREIGVVAGLLGGVTGVLWAVANWRGRLPEPNER
ncbi:MAG TPA: MFS transporter [Bryobacteraceae bacterium]|nr:MFS transporter [Bryobacteraceae bacterium]